MLIQFDARPLKIPKGHHAYHVEVKGGSGVWHPQPVGGYAASLEQAERKVRRSSWGRRFATREWRCAWD